MTHLHNGTGLSLRAANRRGSSTRTPERRWLDMLLLLAAALGANAFFVRSVRASVDCVTTTGHYGATLKAQISSCGYPNDPNATIRLDITGPQSWLALYDASEPADTWNGAVTASKAGTYTFTFTEDTYGDQYVTTSHTTLTANDIGAAATPSPKPPATVPPTPHPTLRPVPSATPRPTVHPTTAPPAVPSVAPSAAPTRPAPARPTEVPSPAAATNGVPTTTPAPVTGNEASPSPSSPSATANGTASLDGSPAPAATPLSSAASSSGPSGGVMATGLGAGVVLGLGALLVGVRRRRRGNDGEPPPQA